MDILKEVVDCARDWIGWLTAALACLGIVFEVTPIKLSPVTAILSWFGKKLNTDTNEKIKKVQETVIELNSEMKTISQQVDDNEIDRIRWEILDFANSLKNGRRHTEDEFRHITDLNEKYHNILAKRKGTNGVVDVEYEYIREVYKQCLHDNSFL